MAADICLVIIYSVAMVGLGAGVMRLISRNGWEAQASPVLRVANGFLLGEGIVASFFLLVGLIPGCFTPTLVTAVVAAGVVGAVLWARNDLFEAVAQALKALRRSARASWLWKIVMGLCLLLAAIFFLCSVLPPRDDGAAFYFALPKLMAYRQQLVPLCQYEAFTQIGLHGELHFAALMSLGGVAASTMFVSPVTLATVVFLLELARRAGVGLKGRWLVLMMVFTSGCFTLMMHMGKVDLFGAALGLAGFYWILQSSGKFRRMGLSLGGFLAGLAVVAKVSLVVTVVPAVAVLAIWRLAGAWKAEGRDSGVSWAILRGGGLAAGWCLLAMLPHVIKNAVMFGEPLAPFVLFEAQAWLNQQWYSAEATRHLLLTYPLALVFGKYTMMGGVLSPLVLAFLPLGLWLPRPKKWLSSPLTILTICGLGTLVLWMTARPGVFAPRYFLPTLLLLTLLPARAAEHFLAKTSRPRWAAGAVFLCILIVMATRFRHPEGKAHWAAMYLLGIRSQAQAAEVHARQAEAINARAAAGERVFLATSYAYFLRPDLINGLQQPAELQQLKELTDSPSRWNALHDMGFRYAMAGLSAENLKQGSTDGRLADLLETTDLPEGMTIKPIFMERQAGNPVTWVVYEIRKRNECE